MVANEHHRHYTVFDELKQAGITEVSVETKMTQDTRPLTQKAVAVCKQLLSSPPILEASFHQFPPDELRVREVSALEGIAQALSTCLKPNTNSEKDPTKEA